MGRNQARDRRSIRLPQYDYTQPGAYTITICTQARAPLFGQIVDGAMCLNRSGEVVQECWREIPRRNPLAELDAFVVMPNHLHGIIVLGQHPPRSKGTACPVPLPRDSVNRSLARCPHYCARSSQPQRGASISCAARLVAVSGKEATTSGSFATRENSAPSVGT